MRVRPAVAQCVTIRQTRATCLTRVAAVRRGAWGALLAGLLLVAQACAYPADPAEEAAAEAAANAPTHCPRGFVNAVKRSTGMDSAVLVRPGRIGLGPLRQFVACALLDSSPDEFGPFAVIVMRADAPENEIRYALDRLGFEEESLGWGRSKTPVGEVSGVAFGTFGSLARNLTENNRRAFLPYGDVFPPKTVVLHAAVRGRFAKPPKAAAEPRSTPLPVVSWHCSWSPTYNNNYHDDALCSNGAESERPHLRAEDSYITPDELMGSARDYEVHLNGG